MSLEDMDTVLKNYWTFSDEFEFAGAVLNDDGSVSQAFIDYCKQKGYYNA